MDQATQETLARLRAERQAEQQREEANRVKVVDVAGGMARGILLVIAFCNLLASLVGTAVFVFLTVTAPANVVSLVCVLLCILWLNLAMIFINGLD